MVCALVRTGLIEARAYKQNETFEAAVRFARAEGIIPAPEPAHAIRAAIDEADAAREAGEARTILFGLCGHGNFDLAAYDAYLAGELEDPEFSEADSRRRSRACPRLPRSPSRHGGRVGPLRYARPRMRRCRLAVGALGMLALLLAPAGARAQSQPAPSKDAAVILILDASKSMKDDDGTGRPKFQAAKEALNTLVDELPDDAKVGLRVYGSEVSGTGRQAGCADTKLVSPVAALDRAAARRGRSPRSNRAASRRSGPRCRAPSRISGPRSRRPSCSSPTAATTAKPPDPCDVAKQISKGGVALKIQAVGFQVKAGARRQLQCIAEAGGGRYVDADDAQELGGQLRALTARALRPYVTQGKRLEPAASPATGQALRARPVHDRGRARRRRRGSRSRSARARR